MTSAFAAPYAKARLVRKALYRRMTKFTVRRATRKNLPPDAASAKR